jgi:hypothetical protein
MLTLRAAYLSRGGLHEPGHDRALVEKESAVYDQATSKEWRAVYISVEKHHFDYDVCIL